jgi:hypothetical protein
VTGEPAGWGGRFRRRPRERWSQFIERVADAFGLVLLLLITTYVVASLTVYGGWSAVAITALACTSGAVALASAGARGALVRGALTLALAGVGVAAVGVVSGVEKLIVLAALAQMLLLGTAGPALLRAVLRESEVGFRTILGAISVYLIVGLLFVSLYVVIDRLQPGPFFANATPHTGDYMFFSFTTLTTTGYGNLVPAGQPGKMFAGLEMLFGQIFLVTLVAGLVSLWRPSGRSP